VRSINLPKRQTKNRRAVRPRLVVLAFLTVAGLVLSGTSGFDTTVAYANAEVTLTFDGNPDQHQLGVVSGSVPSAITGAPGAVTLPGPGALTRAGFQFAGWSVERAGGSPIAAGTAYELTTNTTLYASWGIPESARLFGVGEEAKVKLPTGNPRGITTDGDSIFYLSAGDTAEGTKLLIRKVNFAGVAAGGDITVSGAGASDLMTAIRGGGRDLAYSSGHIFVRENGSAESKLFAISVETGVMAEVAVPPAKPFFEGQNWLKGNIVDFPDGRIGAVSRNKQNLAGTGLACPDGFQCKILRLYNISVSNGSVTATFSEDMLLADNDSRVSVDPGQYCWVGPTYTVEQGSYDGWPCDDHGIATDGTYLYQSHHARGYKVWALQTGSPSYVVFNGDGVELTKNVEKPCGAPSGVSGGLCLISGPYSSPDPDVPGSTTFTLSNATYFTRDHKGNRYIMGDFANPAFVITKASAPPTGPGSEKSVSPPRSVIATPGDGQVVVSWEEPTTGAPILSYTVTATPGGATCSPSGTARTCTISGLANDTAYTFNVVATNADGPSAAATSNSATPVQGEQNPPAEDEQIPPRGGSNQNRPPSGANQNQGLQSQPGVIPPPSTNTPSRNQPPTPQRQLPVSPPPLTNPVSYAGNLGGQTISNRVFVGGQEVVTRLVNQGNQGVALRSDGLEVGLRLDRANASGRVVTNPSSGNRELLVSLGENIVVNAQGLLPGSTVQVWVLGIDGRPELGRAQVNQSGVVESRIAFSGGEAGVTVPVGPRLVQITGVNAAGEPVVVEIAVQVTQGAIAPQKNQDQNRLPSLRPGELEGTSAGRLIDLIITAVPQFSRLVMAAEDWAFTLDLSTMPGQELQVDSPPWVIFTPLGKASLSGAGLLPGTTVSIWLFSEPTLLGTSVVGEDGSFVTEISVDNPAIAFGEHTLQIQAIGSDGFTKAANVGVTLAEGDPVGSPAGALALTSLLVLVVMAGLVVSIAFWRRKNFARVR
jgi:uncharacterized repeat protein (TIGR02543 family)